MIETPLFGRFQGENRRLVFSAAQPYHILIKSCIVGGIAGTVYGMFASIVGLPVMVDSLWMILTSAAVAFAGVLAAFSLQSITFDLKEHVYKRRQGPGFVPTTTFGSFRDLDAIVLIAEPNSRMTPNGTTYHLVLHWKANKEPVMVLQQDTRSLPPGQPLNAGAGPLLQKGWQYAKALGVAFYDNSHFPSANPTPFL